MAIRLPIGAVESSGRGITGVNFRSGINLRLLITNQDSTPIFQLITNQDATPIFRTFIDSLTLQIYSFQQKISRSWFEII